MHRVDIGLELIISAEVTAERGPIESVHEKYATNQDSQGLLISKDALCNTGSS